MLKFGFILAILTFIGFALLWIKVPRWLKKQLVRFPLWFDILMTGLVYMFLGQTLIALLAAAIFGILISGYLYIAKHILYATEPAKEAK